MMRGLSLAALGLGFLLLMAYSWSPDPVLEQEQTQQSQPIPDSTKRAPASNLTSLAPPASPAVSRKEIERLESCYKTETCAFPHTDPRSYHFALSHELALAITAHQDIFGPDAELARAEILNPEPIVQIAALHMLSGLPPSSENLAALANGLKNTPDPLLIEASIKELQRYLGTSMESEAQRIVGMLVAEGAHFSAQKAAEMILPFVNEHSYGEFQQLLGKLPTNSEAYSLLRAALEEFARQKSGA